jgi:hypothetical protein
MTKAITSLALKPITIDYIAESIEIVLCSFWMPQGKKGVREIAIMSVKNANS